MEKAKGATVEWSEADKAKFTQMTAWVEKKYQERKAIFKN
jgi:hypothetical protein